MLLPTEDRWSARHREVTSAVKARRAPAQVAHIKFGALAPQPRPLRRGFVVV